MTTYQGVDDLVLVHYVTLANGQLIREPLLLPSLRKQVADRPMHGPPVPRCDASVYPIGYDVEPICCDLFPWHDGDHHDPMAGPGAGIWWRLDE